MRRPRRFSKRLGIPFPFPFRSSTSHFSHRPPKNSGLINFARYALAASLVGVAVLAVDRMGGDDGSQLPGQRSDTAANGGPPTQMVTVNGQRVERLVSLQDPRMQAYLAGHRQAREEQHGVGWEAHELPEGFNLVRHMVENDASRRVEHLVVDNGSSPVSVYIERLEGVDSPIDGAFEVDGVNVYGMIRDGRQITVVGDASPQMVRRIAHSVRRVGR